MTTTSTKKPTLLHAAIPVIALVLLLALNVLIYGDNSLSGSNQMALLLSAGVAAIVALTLGFRWKTLLDGIKKSIGSTMSAIIILLLIGALAGTWLLSGIVPTMVYYGLKILSPSIFLVAACIISAIVSLATGSSWSTIATIGIALLGIGQALGMGDGLIAGAVISGAYFGDKMSPLSDTTNLAPAMAGTDLFTHIKHMAWTTGPSIAITLLIFLVIGFTSEATTQQDGQIESILAALDTNFNITPWLFLVPAIVIFLIIKKMPAIPALLIGALLGGIFAIIFQGDIIEDKGLKYHMTVEAPAGHEDVVLKWDDHKTYQNRYFFNAGTHTVQVKDTTTGYTGVATIDLPGYSESMPETFAGSADLMKDGKIVGRINITATQSSFIAKGYTAVTDAMTGDLNFNTSNTDVNELLSTSGMFGMLNTIWLIVCAMSFGGVMETAGLLHRMTEAIIKVAKSVGGLIASTAVTCGILNVTASDQYLAIVVPGRMFSKTFRNRGIKPENLSRTLEDSGTVTSVLVPWNTCGATQSSVLGVATGEYWMYCFFNLLSPIMTIAFGYMGIKVSKYSPEEMEENRIEDEKAEAEAKAATL